MKVHFTRGMGNRGRDMYKERNRRGGGERERERESERKRREREETGMQTDKVTEGWTDKQIEGVKRVGMRELQFINYMYVH